MPELKILDKEGRPRLSCPAFAWWPCAAWLDKAAVELDLAGYTQRALPWDW